MSQKRRTLAERNRASIAEPTPETEPNSTAKSTPPPAKPAGTPSESTRQSGSTDTARLGIYLAPEQFEHAKAGYLADWNNGGAADTFAKWIASAIEEHARRTPKQRSTT